MSHRYGDQVRIEGGKFDGLTGRLAIIVGLTAYVELQTRPDVRRSFVAVDRERLRAAYTLRESWQAVRSG